MSHKHDDSEPYDVSQPFDADELLDGFTVEEREMPVDPGSPLGRTVAAARAAWSASGYESIDPDTWKVEPVLVADVEE